MGQVERTNLFGTSCLYLVQEPTDMGFDWTVVDGTLTVRFADRLAITPDRLIFFGDATRQESFPFCRPSRNGNNPHLNNTITLVRENVCEDMGSFPWLD